MHYFFPRIATWFSNLIGKPIAFVVSTVAVLIWLVSGPLFGWSSTWQLVINTFTTIVTFLMLFLLQNTQNRDTNSVHKKLDELIHSIDKADDAVAGIEKKLDNDD